MGLFGISEDYLEKGLSLDTLMIKDKVSTFFFEASNDSMSPAINIKDILVVDRSLTPVRDDIVVLAFEDDLLVRRLTVVSGTICYLADNIDYSPIRASEITVWGVVTGTVRRFR